MSGEPDDPEGGKPADDKPEETTVVVPLGSGRALVVLVNADGHVENRVIAIPPGLPRRDFERRLIEAVETTTARLEAEADLAYKK